MSRFEPLLFEKLLKDESFVRKVHPFLHDEYFTQKEEKIVFSILSEHLKKYNTVPNKESLLIDLESTKGLSEDEYKKAQTVITEAAASNSEVDSQWLIDRTEKFCKDQAIYNAALKAVQVIDPSSKSKITADALPDIFREALKVGFSNQVGHSYLEDADQRYEYYHAKNSKIPFPLESFNNITAGGIEKKTLNVIMGGVNVGKSLVMCHWAAWALSKGMSVLYITCEMAEEKIAMRIDANLMDIPVKEVREIPKTVFAKNIERIRKSTGGRLMIKEFPPASANSNHFRILLDELAIKKDFKPQLVFIDYLNICASSRYRSQDGMNLYQYVKSIAEELRGLAVEYDLPIVTATQLNRSGFTSSDPGMENVSESFGLSATADFIYSIICTEEMKSLNQYMVKQIKNRYDDSTVNIKFMIGVDRKKMKVYDINQKKSGGSKLVGKTTAPPVVETDQESVTDEMVNKATSRKFEIPSSKEFWNI